MLSSAIVNAWIMFKKVNNSYIANELCRARSDSLAAEDDNAIRRKRRERHEFRTKDRKACIECYEAV